MSVDLSKNFLRALHLFNIDNFEITDNDIITQYNSDEYIPLNISFSQVKEDYSLSKNQVTITSPDINRYFSKILTGYMNGVTWVAPTDLKGKRVIIKKIVYDFIDNNEVVENLYPDIYLYPSVDLYPGTTLENYGEMPTSSDYPLLNIDTLPDYNEYILFNGIVKNIALGSNGITLTCTNIPVAMDKLCFTRTYDQSEFLAVTNTMAEEIEWGV